MSEPARSAATPPPTLVLRGIRKEYPGVVALDRVDLDVLPGEILGLVGENGAGKSTLMKVMVGLVQPDSGSITLEGAPVTLRDPLHAAEQGIGMVFQEGSLIPNLTILENLFLCHEHGFQRRGLLSRKAMEAEARRVLERLALKVDLDLRVEEATPAVRQMVEIARLLWLSTLYGRRNPILILDEPTTVLNDDERATLFEALRRLKQQASVVFISHRLQEIVDLADRIVVLKDGRKVAELSGAEGAPGRIEELMVGHTFAADRYRENEQREPGPEVVLEVRGLSRRKGFEPLSFAVRRGEIVSLVGLVGSGKEAVCRCINGLERPDAGEVLLERKRLLLGSPSEAVRRGIGHVPVDRRSDGLALAMSVSENINLLVLERLRVAGLIAPRLELKNATTWIENCRIKTPTARALAGTLSGGNQQKTVIAKWLSSNIRALVLDHPTRGVDVGAKDEIYRILRSLARDGVAMLIMCDTLEEDIGLSNRMLIMKDGKLVREVDCPPSRKPTPREIIQYIV
jgi:ribose transport system ATP-binding protein